MKKMFLICLIFCCFGFLYAQEKTVKDTKVAVAVGAEWNTNSPRDVASAFGGIFNFDVNLGKRLALGLNVTASNDLYGVSVLEPMLLFRIYFSKNHTGMFFQMEGGAYFVVEEVNGFSDIGEKAGEMFGEDMNMSFGGGLRLGARIPMGSVMFMELFGRVGYPVGAGAGVLLGVRF